MSQVVQSSLPVVPVENFGETVTSATPTDTPIVQSQSKKALQSLDNAKFNRSHLQAILVAGSGFLTDSYDNFVIGLMLPQIAYVYIPGSNGSLPAAIDGTVKACSSYGNLVGQLGFGAMGDIFGRKKMYGVELIILAGAAFASSLAGTTAISGVYGLLGILGFWRFILGVGVGGDYPVSAVITSEFANVKRRGTMIATVFAMQGVGILLGSLVAVISLAAAKPYIEADVANMDAVWRFMAAFGVVPCMAAVYYRLTIPETPRFSKDVLKETDVAARDAKQFLNLYDEGAIHADQANTDVELAMVEKQPIQSHELGYEEHHQDIDIARRGYFDEFKSYFSVWKRSKVLLGTSLTWFLLDIGYYGTNLNTAIVLDAIGFNDASTPFNDIWSRAVGQLIISLAGNVPGYWVTVALVDVWGRKPIQYLGFAMLTICFLLMGIFYWQMKANASWAFVLLYALAQFFFNFGPNSTTFIIPAECFPTKVRSTAHGISAASGKLGAILAAQVFSLLANVGGKNQGVPMLMYIFAVCCFLGGVATILVPETKGKSLEDLEAELE